MKVDEVMNRTVYTCKPNDSLKEATQLLWTHDIGCLVVTDEAGKATGMVTDRDLLMCTHLSGRGLHEEIVSSAMSKQLYAVRAGESVQAAEALMQSKQVRRLAVIGPEGRVVGVLSLNDLALAAGKKKDVRPEDVAAILASICQPRPTSATARG
ncbi:MAG: CBS domain-containing protein [Archangium sp.]|nr:CBS domain-containing protein [Archangium sp.]